MRNPIGTILQSGQVSQSAGVSFEKMRVLGSYALVFLTGGGGHYQMQGAPLQACRTGDVLVVFPEIAHGYGPDGGGRWDELYLVFGGPVFDLWRERGWLTPEDPILRPRPLAPFAEGFRRLVVGEHGGSPALENERVCRLQAWLASAMRANTRTGERKLTSAWQPWIDEAIQHMKIHPSAPLENIARACGHSAESFRKKFRALMGESPCRYRDRLMVAAAKKLIYEERLANKEIAERLGICDEFHFSKRFRQISGMSPSVFRRSLRA